MLNYAAFKLPWLFVLFAFQLSVLDAEDMQESPSDSKENDMIFLDPDPVTVKNKLRYLYQLSHVSPLIKRVHNSGCEDAQLLLKSAVNAHGNGELELEQDNLESALEYADQGLRAMATVAKILPNKAREKQAEEVRFEKLHTHVTGLQKTLSRVEVDASNGALTDLDGIISQSEQLSEAGNYQQATQHLAAVATQLEQALNDAYDTDTLVYELEFDTPEEEYQYEDRRNQEYIRLAEVLRQKDTNSSPDGRGAVIDQSQEKNAALRSEAEILAKSGRFEMATKKMEDGSRILANAMRSLGLAVQ